MTELVTWLYYWDARDGVGWQGWWIAPEVGSQNFMAFGPGDAASPVESRDWLGGAQRIDVWVASLNDGLIGVRAIGLGFEGAYERDASHVHDHGKRPVYYRLRDLSATEEATIDAMRRPEAESVVIQPLRDAAATHSIPCCRSSSRCADGSELGHGRRCDHR